MAVLSGGRAVVLALERNGVDTVFGIPGVHTLEIYDALNDAPAIKSVVNRHEQGSGFMADGYARAGGNPGVCVVITGPGLTNLATALGQAYSDSSPVVVISSEIESKYQGQGRGLLHELPDQLGLIRHLVRYSAQIDRVKDVPAFVRHALRHHRTARPGPVHLQLPTDVLAAQDEVELDPQGLEPPTAAPDPGSLHQAALELAAARRPMLYVGGGAQGAAPQVQAVAEWLGAPVVTTCLGKGVIPDDHPLALDNSGTSPDLEEWWREADAVLAVGTRFGPSSTANWSMPIPRRLLHIDIDRSELGRNYPAAVAIRADSALALQQLLAELQELGPARVAPAAIGTLKHRLQAARERQTWQWGILAAIRSALGREGILVSDMTILGYTATRSFPVYCPRSFLFPRGFGTLGFALPAAAGACLARPRHRVVALAGDGGFLFTAEELAVAVQHRLPVTVVLVNSQSYEVVRRMQVRQFGRDIGVDLVNPDFMRLAEAFGIPGMRAVNGEALAEALAATAGAGGPVLIEVPYREE